ncbi:hypothetical protein ATCC90586_003008 [Pythium insidiosum]|nr:hypothetical protein ATCC90586_003008 [Pythium insidiosum]
MAPDFLAEILAAESERDAAAPAPTAPALPLTLTLKSRNAGEQDDEDDDDDDDSTSIASCSTSAAHAAQDDSDEQEDANLHHVLLNFPEYLLVDILYYLDEDAVGHCLMTCHRLRHVAQSEAVFETLCRRIFPAQCPRARHGRLQLRKFPTWLAMLQRRPRVRHNGFYFLKTYYYKKPELNMWTEIAPGTILQVVYYRYFSFQRDGTVLYAMLFKPPHDAGAVLRRARHHHYVAEPEPSAVDHGSGTTIVKEVWRGTFHVERDEVLVSVPTNHCVVEFRFRVASRGAARHSCLVLLEHYAFSEPDRSGWIDYFDTHDEELHFYRHWDL